VVLTKILPNALSSLRIIALPIIIWIVDAGYEWLALMIFISAAVTDYLDGFYARKHKTSSEVGAFWDPLCDKILLVSLLVWFDYRGKISEAAHTYVMLLLVFESCLIAVRLPRFFGIQYKISANWYGKIKMAFEVAIIIILLGKLPWLWAEIFLASALVLAVVSLFLHSLELYHSNI